MRRHQVFNMIKNVYSDAPQGSYGNIVCNAIQDFNYPNGQPLNILKAIYLLRCLRELVTLGTISKGIYQSVFNDCVIFTGYNRKELLDRIYV